MLPVPSNSKAQPLSLEAAGSPLRSPRTSIILAELARQRRYERRERRLKRQKRRCARAQVVALSRRYFEAVGTPVLPGVSDPEAMSLIALSSCH